VHALLESKKIKYVSRSSQADVGSDASMLLLDTTGELLGFYAAANLAFVGGSLVPIGGHNVLEPAALGLATLCGVHMSSNQESVDLLRQRDGLVMVDSTTHLADHVVSLAGDVQRRAELGRNALAVVNENRGAVERVLALIALAK
jgi:3-deoxy-D-manno-octulosonic-acid transferase